MEVEGEGEVWPKQFCVFSLSFQRRRTDGEVGHVPLVPRAPPFPLFLDSQPETCLPAPPAEGCDSFLFGSDQC